MLKMTFFKCVGAGPARSVSNFIADEYKMPQNAAIITENLSLITLRAFFAPKLMLIKFTLIFDTDQSLWLLLNGSLIAYVKIFSGQIS